MRDLRCLLRRVEVQDALIALVFTASTIVITVGIDRAEPGRSLDGWAFLTMAGVGLSLALRHRRPVPALYAATVATVAYLSLGYPGGPVFLGVFILIGTVASLYGTRQALGPVLLAVLALAVAAAVRGLSGEVVADDEPFWAHLLYLSWAVVAFLAGKAVRDRRELLAGLRERNRHLEETREEEALRRVAEERVRIARDLHDIVAHNIAGISLQAATGAHVAGAHPDQAHAALVAIREASRQTLDELRSTLHLLRQGEDTAPLAPTPGLDALGDLVGAVVANGVPVTLDVTGVVAEVPDAVAGAAFRIVQESLTNVMRHAGPATASVEVEARAGALAVRVVDDGRGATAFGAEAGGHGIAGMNERAVALGGTVTAGPRPGGGFAVEAWLPFARTPAGPSSDRSGGAVPRPGAASLDQNEVGVRP